MKFRKLAPLACVVLALAEGERAPPALRGAEFPMEEWIEDPLAVTKEAWSDLPRPIRDPSHNLQSEESFGRQLGLFGYKDVDSFKPPTPHEYTQLVLKEIKNQKKKTGTFNLADAVNNVMSHIIAHSGVDIMDNATVAALVAQLDLGAMLRNATTGTEKQDLFELEKVVLGQSNSSLIQCQIPGMQSECMTTKRAIEVKNFIKARLNKCIKDGELPSIDKIYMELKDEMGVDADQADKLIENSPKIRYYLKKKMLKTDRVVKRKSMAPILDLIEQTLIDGAHNLTTYDESIAKLGYSPEMMNTFLKAMGRDRRERIMKLMNKPREDYKAMVEVHKKLHDFDSNKTGHAYVRLIEEKTNAQGHRVLVLQHIPHPVHDGDGIKGIEEEYKAKAHSRRLVREKRGTPKHTKDFERMLTEHVEELHGHIRELQLTCKPGASNVRCVANGLGALGDDLAAVISRVQPKLAPLNTLLIELDNAHGTMDTADTLAGTIVSAFAIVKAIPPFKTAFSRAHGFLKPIADQIHSAFTKADAFDTNVNDRWKSMITKVEAVISAFDAEMVFKIISGASLAAEITENQCIRSVVQHLAGTDLMQPVDVAVGQFKDYIVALYNALDSLATALDNEVWKNLEAGLNAIVTAIQPVKLFFDPFEPIKDLIKREVRIKPWLAQAYDQIKLGGNSCPAGYEKEVEARKCWEKDGDDWREVALSIPPKQRVTCKRGGMGDHWDQLTCVNDKHDRSTCGITAGCGCSSATGCGFMGCCPCCSCWAHCNWENHVVSALPGVCIQNCAAGYSTYPFQCKRDNCGTEDGYKLSTFKDYCDPVKQRDRPSKGSICTQPLEAGRSYMQNELAECWQSCGPGHTLALGQCFPPAELKVSIEMVMGYLNKFLNIIEGLPIYKQISDAMDFVIGGVLKPITDFMESWLKPAIDGLGLGSFPDVSVDLMPTVSIDGLVPQMPAAPDFSQLMDLPSQAYQSIMQSLPAPLNELAGCEMGDIACAVGKLGLDPSKFIDTLTGIFGQMEAIKDQLVGMVKGIECVRWSQRTIPCSDALAKLGFPDIPQCDIEIDQCDEFDTSAVQPIIDSMAVLFDPIISFLRTPAARRLLDAGAAIDITLSQAASGAELWWPFLGVKVAKSRIGDRVSGQTMGEWNFLSMKSMRWDSANGKWEETVQAVEKQPVGMHVRVERTYFVNFGVLIQDGQYKFGIEPGFKADFKFGATKGARELLKEAIRLAKKRPAFYESVEYKSCYATVARRLLEEGVEESLNPSDSIDVFAETFTEEFNTTQVTRQLEAVQRDTFSPKSPEFRTPCQKIRRAVDIMSDVPIKCTLSNMQTSFDQMSASQKPTTLQTKDTVACIQHYFASDKRNYDAVVNFKNALDLDLFLEVYPDTCQSAMTRFFGCQEKLRDDVGLLMSLAWVKTDWLTRPFLGSKYPPVRIIGRDAPEDWISFGVGVEIKDYKTNSRLGPYVHFGANGFRSDWSFESAYQHWNFGEFSFVQLAGLLGWAGHGIAANIGTESSRQIQAALNQHEAKQNLVSGLSDTMTAAFFSIEIAAVIDTQAVMYPSNPNAAPVPLYTLPPNTSPPTSAPRTAALNPILVKPYRRGGYDWADSYAGFYDLQDGNGCQMCAWRSPGAAPSGSQRFPDPSNNIVWTHQGVTYHWSCAITAVSLWPSTGIDKPQRCYERVGTAIQIDAPWGYNTNDRGVYIVGPERVEMYCAWIGNCQVPPDANPNKDAPYQPSNCGQPSWWSCRQGVDLPTWNTGLGYFDGKWKNIWPKQATSCARPTGWCAHSNYNLVDCDGDGIPDHTCYNENGAKGTILGTATSNCAASWPNAPENSCPAVFGTCARPGGGSWCTHAGSTYKYLDCNGDGVPDHVCYDKSGRKGIVSMANNCASTWWSAPQSSCPAAFGTCARPAGWCTHGGSTYNYVDCDGDGLPDHVCYDKSGNRGIISAANNCASTWPIAPENSCPAVFGRCSRPAGWCTHGGAKYNYVDCDGNGLPDHVCYDKSGQRGIISTANNCVSTWPSAPQHSCPAAFGNCARGQWCTHGGATYEYWDCSGNGQAQHICRDNWGRRGYMHDNCGHNWPHGGHCPGIF